MEITVLPYGEPKPSYTQKWCSCGGDPVTEQFMADGTCVCQLYKHHVHCERCGGLAQVG